MLKNYAAAENIVIHYVYPREGVQTESILSAGKLYCGIRHQSKLGDGFLNCGEGTPVEMGYRPYICTIYQLPSCTPMPV